MIKEDAIKAHNLLMENAKKKNIVNIQTYPIYYSCNVLKDKQAHYDYFKWGITVEIKLLLNRQLHLQWPEDNGVATQTKEYFTDFEEVTIFLETD